jgi:hypothetical protein
LEVETKQAMRIRADHPASYGAAAREVLDPPQLPQGAIDTRRRCGYQLARPTGSTKRLKCVCLCCAGSTVNSVPIKSFRSRCNRLIQRALAA